MFMPLFPAVAFVVLIACFVSLAFVPIRCAGWLRGHTALGHESHTTDYRHRNKRETRCDP
jgi:multidrug efflux pump subunit AcrB